MGADSVKFLDERTIDGPIIYQLDEALAFVTRNTRQALRITGKPAHDVVPEYPNEAVREAIINALCHRDYAHAAHVQVRIYDDRLEVWNPGRLPHDLTIEQLYGQHHSHPRNPLIAQALHRARLIEQWGTGTLRILEACRERHIATDFESGKGMFIVRLRQREEGRHAIVDTSELNERQRKAMAFLETHDRLSRSKYERLTGASARTANRDLLDMTKLGIILQVGKGKSASYRLKGS